MDNFYQQFRERVNAARRESCGQELRTFVGRFELPLSSSGQVELPETFALEQSDEFVVGLHEAGDALLVYESFLWHMLDELSDAALKASFRELEIRGQGPGPALVYLSAEHQLVIPEYLLEAASLQESVQVEGTGMGFRLSKVAEAQE